MKFGTRAKWRVPEKLVEYLLSALDEKEEKFSFKREDYAVRNEYVQQIEANFDKRADRDCFATEKNSRCAAFYTAKEDALRQDWGEGETLWLNPHGAFGEKRQSN